MELFTTNHWRYCGKEKKSDFDLREEYKNLLEAEKILEEEGMEALEKFISGLKKKKDDKVTVEPEDISELNVAVDKLNKEKKILQGISSNLKTSVDSLGRYRKDLELRGVYIPGRKSLGKPVEINEELLASVQAKINEMAKKGKGGVKRAQSLQTAWDNYLASLEKFETNKSVEDIEQEIKTLRAGFTGK